MDTTTPDPIATALNHLRAQMAETMTCTWCPEPAAGTGRDVVLDPDAPAPEGLHFSCGRPGHGREFTYGPGMIDLPSLVTHVRELLAATNPETYANATEDGHGRVAATNRLGCTYCGGTVAPELEYSGFAHSEHRDWVRTECEDCGATWDRAGAPDEGPWASSLRYDLARRAEKAAGQ